MSIEQEVAARLIIADISRQRDDLLETLEQIQLLNVRAKDADIDWLCKEAIKKAKGEG